MADSFAFEWRVHWGNRVGKGWAGKHSSADEETCKCADGFPHHRDVCLADLEYGTPSPLHPQSIIMRKSSMLAGGEY